MALCMMKVYIFSSFSLSGGENILPGIIKKSMKSITFTAKYIKYIVICTIIAAINKMNKMYVVI